MRHKKPQIGDCFLIPLSDGRFAYGQFVFWDHGNGPLSRIFAWVTETPLPLTKVLTEKLMFPPVFIGFGSVFRDGRWRILGSLPVTEFVFPRFRSSFATRPGKYHDWKIYDGENMIAVDDLSPPNRSLEFLCGWSPQAI